MVEYNIVQMIKRWKPKSKRPIGRPKKRWQDDVLEDKKHKFRKLEACSTEYRQLEESR
jgi:hypothetical protein